MASTTCSIATNNIASLDDLPNDVGGLTAAQLKALFDKFGVDLVAWFNATHIGTDKIHIGDNPAARVYHDANQSIANVTYTQLAFNSERFDTNVMHDTTTNNTRLTCKTAGKYLIWGCVEFESNITGWRFLEILLNGSIKTARELRTPLSGSTIVFTISTVYDLAVNDYVELQVYQSSGGALNVNVAGNHSPEFSMVRVG